MTTQELLRTVKAAAPALAEATTAQKNQALLAMAAALEANCGEILTADRRDVAAAQGHIAPVMIDRLALSRQRVLDIAEGVRPVAALPDPVGRVRRQVVRPIGMTIHQVGVAMGVVAIIYESRPNVTSDAAALALKAGSACVLRGGKEAFASSKAIVSAMQAGLETAGLPADLIGLVEDTTRNSATELMQAVGYVDLLIPRGGAGLIRAVTENAKVPCIQTGTGICHVYVDKAADLSMALSIVENAKTSRPSVCNAEEVLLVHEAVAAEFLPRHRKRLVDDRAADGKVPVELRLCPKAAEIIPGEAAGAQDFDTEFLDYILAVKVVDSLDEAIAHIAAHSTGHSEAIVTADEQA